MKFKEAYTKFMKKQLKHAKGLRLNQLKKDLGEATRLCLEKVWWPAFGHFENLHLEFEVRDFKDGRRFLDLAFIKPFVRICIEIDGFGPHWQNMSQEKFADDRIRQNHLVIDGWIVIRFAYLDIVNHPRRCQQILQQLIGQISEKEIRLSKFNKREQLIINRSKLQQGVIKLRDVMNEIEISDKTAKKILSSLVLKKALIPLNSGNMKRIHSYQLAEKYWSENYKI